MAHRACAGPEGPVAALLAVHAGDVVVRGRVLGNGALAKLNAEGLRRQQRRGGRGRVGPSKLSAPSS